MSIRRVQYPGGDVHRLLTRALILETALLFTTVSLEPQDTAVSKAPAIEVSMGLQKDKVPVGQSPWVNLRVENLTDREITMSEAVPHVEGDEGELPMKPNTEIITDRPQPRPRLRTAVYVAWTIAPKDSSIHQYQLAHFFNLSRPGQYTVHMEVADPSSQKLLRTNSAKFEMQSPRH
jgi:hypothetical protein